MSELLIHLVPPSPTSILTHCRQKINENCFDACVPAPGSSFSSGESTCLSNCMQKYITMWNITSRTYINRVAVESKRVGGDASTVSSLGSGL